MTDDLVKRLRDEESYYRWQEKHWCVDFDLLERLHLEAADRIEALTAENERLREVLNQRDQLHTQINFTAIRAALAGKAEQ